LNHRVDEERVLAEVIKVKPLVSSAECDGMFGQPIQGQCTVGCHSDLLIGELLLPLVLLGSMAPENDIDLLVNAREGSTTTPTLLLWLILLDRFSLWYGATTARTRDGSGSDFVRV
jgi:hypothetical protein